MAPMFRTLVAALMLFGLAACGDPSKEDLLQKAANPANKAELLQRLGKPADVAKLGPLERWTYKASNGSVVYVLTGDKVALEATGGAEHK